MRHSIAALKRYENANIELRQCIDGIIDTKYLLRRLGVKKNTGRFLDNDALTELVGCLDTPLIHLQKAFWEDTKHINSKYNCKFVDEYFIRKMIKNDTTNATI